MSEKFASYTVSFERIGRTHHVPPLNAEIAEPSELGEEIADAVHRRAYKYLRSRDYEVFVNLDERRGFIACGMHSGGEFTIELHSASPQPETTNEQ